MPQAPWISTALINPLMVSNRGSNGRSLPLMKAILMDRKVQENCNLCLQVHLQKKKLLEKTNKIVIQFCKERGAGFGHFE